MEDSDFQELILILSLTVEVNLQWKLQISPFFVSGKTWKIGSVSNTYLPHYTVYIYLNMYIHMLYIKTPYTLHKQYTCPFLTVFASKFLNAYILTIHCRGITVKTHWPGVLNEDQESEMQSIRKFTEENSWRIIIRRQLQYSQWSLWAALHTIRKHQQLFSNRGC